MKTDQLEEELHTLKANSRLTTSNHHTENLIVFARMLLVLGLEEVDETTISPNYNYLTSHDTSLIRFLITHSVDLIYLYYESENSSERNHDDLSCKRFIELLQKNFEDKNFPTIHPYRAVIDLRDNSSYLAAVSYVENLKKRREPEEIIISGFFKKLYTVQGLRYSGQPFWVKNYWASLHQEFFNSLKYPLLARIDHRGIKQALKVYEEEVKLDEEEADINFQISVLQCYPRELTFLGQKLSKTLKEYHRS